MATAVFTDKSDCVEYILHNSWVPTLVGAYVGWMNQHKAGYGVLPGGMVQTILAQHKTMIMPALYYGGVSAIYFGLDCLIEHYREKRTVRGPMYAGAITGYLVGGWKGWPQCAGYPLAGACIGGLWHMLTDQVPKARKEFDAAYGPMKNLEWMGDPVPGRDPVKRQKPEFIFRNRIKDPVP